MKKRKANLKKILSGIFLIALLAAPSLLKAQENHIIDKLFKRHNDEKNFTIVNISKEMFQFLGQMSADTTKESKELSNVVNNLNGMKILSCSNDADSKFYNEIIEAIPLSEYAEIMTVKDEDSNVKFLAKKKGENFCELIMIARDGKETTLLFFSGEINLKDVSKLSKGVSGMGIAPINF